MRAYKNKLHLRNKDNKMQNKDEQNTKQISSDLALVKKIQSGSSEAFSALYDLYVNRIYRFVYYRTGHKETAEDLTSVTFTKAYQNIHSFKSDQGIFAAWLYKIARNTVIDHMRTHKQTMDLNAAADVADKANIAGQAEVSFSLEKIQAYLSELDETQRDVVMMRLWDDLPYSEISLVVGKSEGNCKVIFSRALQKIKQELVPLLSAITTLLISQ